MNTASSADQPVDAIGIIGSYSRSDRLSDRLSSWTLFNTPTDTGNLRNRSIRLTRVLLVSLGMFTMFFALEHDTSFIGLQSTDIKEENLKDRYVDEIEAGSQVRKIALFLFAAVGATALGTCRDREIHFSIVPLGFFLALLCWALCSFFWSDDPSLTFKRLVALLFILIGAAGCARLLRPSELMLVALVTLTAFVSTSFLLDLKAGGRPWTREYRFGGTLHPNVQAAYCAMLCIAAYCFPVRFGKRWMTRGLFLFGISMLYLTASRTGLLALLVALGIVFLLRLKSQVRWIAATIFCTAAALFLITYGSLSDGERNQLTGAALMGRTEQSSSLSGRVPLWKELSNYSTLRPFTGYGYENFWTPDRIDAVMKSQKWTMQSAHNAYLEITLQLGFIGLALALPLTLVYWNGLQTAYARTYDAGYAFLYGLVAFGLMNGLLESHFAKTKYPTVIALIGLFMVIFIFPTKSKTEKTSSLSAA